MPKRSPASAPEAPSGVFGAITPARDNLAHSPSVTSTRTAHLPALDGLRGAAVLMVFLHHAYRLPGLWSGVDLFFILSGYLITNILLRDSGRMRFGPLIGRFYLRRAQRILPAYGLVLLLVTLLTYQDWRRLWPYYAFFLQNVPYALHMIDFGPLVPLWSLAVEQHFYLVWPFVVFFVPRRRLAPVLAGILVGVPLLRILMTPLFAHPEAIYSLSPFRIDTMAAGALAALVLPKCDPARCTRYAWMASILTLCIYASLSWEPWFRRGANSRAFNGLGYSGNLIILSGLFVIVTLAPPTATVSRLFSWAPLRGLGRISYTFYLLHLLFLTQWAGRLNQPWGVPAIFLACVTAATLSWFLLEKPVLSLGGAHRGASLEVRSSS